MEIFIYLSYFEYFRRYFYIKYHHTKNIYFFGFSYFYVFFGNLLEESLFSKHGGFHGRELAITVAWLPNQKPLYAQTMPLWV